MFCKNCGKEIKDTEKFCPNCGRPVGDVKSNTPDSPSIQTTGSGSRTKKINSKIIGILIAVVVVLAIVIKLIAGNTEKKQLPFYLTVVNNTGLDIYGLYASETDIDNWEEDLLGDDILFAGDQFVIRFVITEDNLDWDFAMEDEYGDMIEFYDLSFADCDMNEATLILDYDGIEGTAVLY